MPPFYETVYLGGALASGVWMVALGLLFSTGVADIEISKFWATLLPLVFVLLWPLVPLVFMFLYGFGWIVTKEEGEDPVM